MNGIDFGAEKAMRHHELNILKFTIIFVLNRILIRNDGLNY
jgi:hypothetical protein